VTRATRVALLVTAFFVILCAAIGGSFLLTTMQITSNNQQWCDALKILTQDTVPSPADPKANPSREQTYLLYEDFMKIHEHFRCAQ
jgi:hypothetical protein